MDRRKAFTLAELIVVISVIALVVAIVLPTFQSAWAVARSLMCRNHLKRIGEATHIWAVGNSEATLDVLASGGWTGVVTMNTGGTEVLKCPEGGPLTEGSPAEGQMVIRTDPASSVCIPLVSLSKSGDFVGSFKVLKLSQTQYKAGIGEGARYKPVLYVPDNTPNTYWWGYDDGAIGTGDYDFQDLALRITNSGDGTATVYVTGATAGKPEIWSPDLKIEYASWEKINLYHNKSAPGVTFKLSVGGASHYALNESRLDMRGGRKIEALDYLCTVAKSTDDWASKEWDKDKDGRPDFLRHAGRLNVLLVDGSATVMSRDDVDPQADINNERVYWQRGTVSLPE
jgi:prepilin-type N-terminal cleavage/methylation domain-containing protein/prepilin-type processing-associated H-X9-DG protein